MQVQKTLHMMGTTIDILVESDQAKELLTNVCYFLQIYDHRFSANRNDSELMAVNNSAGIKAVQVEPELFELIEIGKNQSLTQPSNLDIAIGSLVKIWHIGFDDARLPSQALIKKQLALINPHDIILDAKEQSIFLAKKDMQIDLGALAKGYIADKLMMYLKEQEVTSAMINLGGNLLVYGSNPNRSQGFWHIGIQNPKLPRNQHIGLLKVYNQSVVTSGIYERHFQTKGEDYHHIFDKKTGYPIKTDMASLTIVSASSLDGEIWTSRLFGLPIPLAFKTINQTDFIEGIIITRENQLLISDGLKHIFTSYY